MLRTILKIAVGAGVLAFALGSFPACAQDANVNGAPPTHVSVGALVKNGGRATFGLQFGGNINVVKKLSSDPARVGEVIGQVYTRVGGFLADDAVVEEGETKELEAITAIGIGERFFGDYSLAAGMGMQIESTTGENIVRSPLLIEAGYRPVEMLKLHVGIQYIPVIGSGDWTLIYGGFGFDI